MFVVITVIAFFSADIVQASGTSNSPLDVTDATSVSPLQPNLNSQSNYSLPTLPKLLSKREIVLQEAAQPYDTKDIVITSDNDGSDSLTAEVKTAKGLLEAIFDPANTTWNNPSWQAQEGSGTGALAGNMGVGSIGNPYGKIISQIHTIIIDNNIDLPGVDDNIANSYGIRRPNVNAKFGQGSDRGNYSKYKYVNIRHDNLTIEGKNLTTENNSSKHPIISMGYNDFALGCYNTAGKLSYSDNQYKEDWTIKNLNIYDTDFYGFVSCNTGLAVNRQLGNSKPGDPDPTNPKNTLTASDQNRIDRAKDGLDGGYSWITYEDDNFIGSQFAWTHDGTSGVTIKGTVRVNSVYSYKLPAEMNSNYIWQTDSSGNQQNFQVDQLVFDKDSHFYGSTYDGNVLQLTGSVKLMPGATVDLYPHGYYGNGLGPEDSNLYLGWGVYFISGDARLNLYGNSKLNIHCNMQDGNYVFDDNGNWQSGVSIEDEQNVGINNNRPSGYTATAGAMSLVSSSSNIAYHETKDGDGKMLSPEINIDSDGPIYGNHPLVNFGGGNAELSHGKFSIDAYNLNQKAGTSGSNNGWNYTNNDSSSTGGLMTVTGTANIDVKTGGDFSIAAHNKTYDDSTGNPVTLLYYSGGQINLMNPKNVSLDLRDHNDPDSILVFAPNQARINAYDTRIQAKGDNTTPNNARDTSTGVSSSRTTKIPSLDGDKIENNFGIKYQKEQTISLGMGDSSDPNGKGGTCTSTPIRVQTLTLPFYRYAIDFVQYLTSPGSNVIQGRKDDLNLLKAAMVQMNGREFRYVRLSDLPGPTEDDVDKVGVPGANLSQRNITGKVGGDYWANDGDKIDKNLFIPTPPLLRVQLKHKNSDSLVDLGTMTNSYAAQEKTNMDPINADVTEVTPNPIDNNRNVRTDNKGNYMIGKKITTDSTNPQPHYLDSSIVTWDIDGWSNTSSSENDPQHSFSYNLQEVLDKYNENGNHKDNKISFQPGDQVLTSVVTNYQETPVQNTRITNLYLQKGDEPKTPFLIGDQIKMPFQYIDTNANASPLHIKGTIYKLDDKGKKTQVNTFEHDISINKTSNWTDSHLDLDGATSAAGNYVVEFNGTDNAGNAGPDAPVSWKYTVSSLPKYNGKKVINDHTTGDTTNPSKIVSNLQYTVKTVFEIANKSNPQSLSQVKFKHPRTIGDNIDNTDQSIRDNSDYTLTASYNGHDTTIKDFQYDTTYEPKDFNLNLTEFPAGVKFTITHKIWVNADVVNAGVQIGADQMYSKENNNDEDILLSTSNIIKYKSVGSIVLNVGNSIDYGTNPAVVPFKKERVFFIRKSPTVSIRNNTPYSQPVTLTAQVDDGGTSVLNNWLYYRQTKDNTDDSDTLMKNTVTAFHSSIKKGYTQDVASGWFKDGQQVTGPILKLGQNSSPNLGTPYKTNITWNLTNSL